MSKIINWYKGRCSYIINRIQKEIRFQWQSRFYDVIISDEKMFFEKRGYIINNPEKWERDHKT